MSQARRLSQRRAVSVGIHDLPHEVMLHICETLTPRETCTMMLGLGKRSVIFRCVSEVAILRGSALGKQIEKREGLKCTEDALKYILGRPVESKDHKSVCTENACAWLALPAPMCSALLVAPADYQIDALRGAAFLGLLPLAQLHARATEHGATVIKREHSETEKQACKEAVAFCRKALPQSDESQALRQASVSMVTDAERRFTNVYLQLFQDHELRRHNAESASSANTALFRFIDQHLATATGVRLGPVENMHNSALVGLLAGGLLGNSAKEDDEKQDFLSKVMSRCEKPLSLQRSQRERRFCDLCLQPIEGMYAGCRSCGFDCCPRCVDPASQPTHVCVPLDVATRMHLFVELCQTADGLEDARPSAIAAQEQLSAAQIDYQAFLAKRAEHDATLLRLAKGGHLHELKIWLDACYGGAAAMGPRMVPEPPCLASHVRDLFGVASLPSSTASSAGPSRLSRS